MLDNDFTTGLEYVTNSIYIAVSNIYPMMLSEFALNLDIFFWTTSLLVFA